MNRCRLETIRAYWSGRVVAYSAVNADELGTIQAKVWDELIAEQLPWKHPLRILDAGCGPGFFSILMARRGHEITGVDYSEAMIECARENIENHSPEASAYFFQMDAQDLTFEDDTFDVVLSRNLTWNLEHPDRAYAEWLRVLRPGGVLLNFDANWHAHLFDPELARLYAEDAQTLRAMGYAVEDEHGDPIMDELIPQLPLSREQRPGWDKACLERLGCRDVLVRAALPPDIMNDYYRIRYTQCSSYGASSSEKAMTELEAIRRYWNTRAEGYSLKTAYDLQHAEKVWLERLRPFVLASGRLDILDIGCGPGFFSILLARLGHSVVAFDYTEGMLERASRNAAEADVSIVVRQGDAQDLPFPDETFDLIVSRNLMWNLEHPESAYAEWLRVLRPGGRLVNFDGNHYRHLYSEPYAEELKQPDYTDGHNPDFMLGVDPAPIHAIAANLPLSRVDRPQWDVETLLKLGARNVTVDVERKHFVDGTGQPVSIIKRFMVSAQKEE